MDNRFLSGSPSHSFFPLTIPPHSNVFKKYFHSLIKLHCLHSLTGLFVPIYLILWYTAIRKHCKVIKYPNCGMFICSYPGTAAVCKQYLLTSLEVGLVCFLWLLNEYFPDCFPSMYNLQLITLLLFYTHFFFLACVGSWNHQHSLESAHHPRKFPWASR